MFCFFNLKFLSQCVQILVISISWKHDLTGNGLLLNLRVLKWYVYNWIINKMFSLTSNTKVSKRKILILLLFFNLFDIIIGNPIAQVSYLCLVVITYYLYSHYLCSHYIAWTHTHTRTHARTLACMHALLFYWVLSYLHEQTVVIQLRKTERRSIAGCALLSF